MAAQTSSYKARSQVKHPLPSLDRSVIKRSSLKKKKKSSRPLTDWLRPASSRCGVNGRFLNEEPAAAAGGDGAARVGRPYRDYPNSINKVINPGCTMAPRPRAAIKRHYMAGVTAKEFTHTHTHTRHPSGARALWQTACVLWPWKEQPGSRFISRCLPNLVDRSLAALTVKEAGEPNDSSPGRPRVSQAKCWAGAGRVYRFSP